MTDIDEELGALYRAARAQEPPSRADREAVRRSLAVALAVTTTAASAHAAAGTLTAGSAAATQTVQALTIGKIATWLCVGAALGGVTSSVAWVVTPPPAVPVVEAVSAPRSATVQSGPARSKAGVPPALPVAAAPLVSAMAPAPVPLAARASSSSAGATVTRERAAATDPAPSLAARSLALESEGLLAVQRALAQGDAPSALGMLDEQDARFQGGALAEERAVARVLGLCAAGRTQQARAARERFMATYPRSPHAQRVQNSCAK